MAEVKPLPGLRYSPDSVGDLAQVITPPFDVISKEDQARYYARNPYNIIRLELNKEEASDSDLDNVYTRAAAIFSEWRLKQTLHQEEAPCYYFYQQTFNYGDQTYTRTSLLARVRIEPWDARVVLPHENTLAKAREDRLRLLRACNANFSPIMSLYEDPQGRLRRLLSSYASTAQVQIVDEDGVKHLLHPITDQQQIALIQDFFSQRQLFIADGHHRYTTALNYRDEVHALHGQLTPDDGVNFVLMALIDINDPGMLVLPTHRLLAGLSQEMLDKLSQPAQYFTSQQLTAGKPEELLAHLEQAGQQQPSLLVQTASRTLLLRLNEEGARAIQSSGRTTAWNQLDVALVQYLLFEKLLGISAEDVSAGKYVSYTHDAQEAFLAVQSGKATAAVLLNSTPLRQVCDVALADDRMPQKSTYIYPKLITGLVINPLW